MADIYEDIKNSFTNDYWTAGYKAEVSFDTLLTPVIEKIIQTKFTDAIYVTKEFPILKRTLGINSTSGFDSINADYVLSNNDTVYFVELKTTMDSINDDQEDNYFKMLEKPTCFNIWGDDFIMLLNHNSDSGIGDDRFKNINKDLFSKDIKNQSDNTEILLKCFRTICERHKIPATPQSPKKEDFYQETAIRYLKNKRSKTTTSGNSRLSGKNKTLFQAGQILDYCSSPNDKNLSLWRKNIQIVYLLPSYPSNSDKHPGTFEYLNFVDAIEKLKDSDPYCNFLYKIVKDVYLEDNPSDKN